MRALPKYLHVGGAGIVFELSADSSADEALLHAFQAQLGPVEMSEPRVEGPSEGRDRRVTALLTKVASPVVDADFREVGEPHPRETPLGAAAQLAIYALNAAFDQSTNGALCQTIQNVRKQLLDALEMHVGEGRALVIGPAP